MGWWPFLSLVGVRPEGAFSISRTSYFGWVWWRQGCCESLAMGESKKVFKDVGKAPWLGPRLNGGKRCSRRISEVNVNAGHRKRKWKPQNMNLILPPGRKSSIYFSTPLGSMKYSDHGGG